MTKPETQREATRTGMLARFWSARWPWPTAGLMAGAAVGVVDTVWAVRGGIGGLTAGKGTVLVLLGGSWGGVAGLLVGLAIALAAALVERRARARAWWPEALAALAALPLVTYGAFSAFTGHKAASLPAHHAISVGLALAGTAAVALVARAVRVVLARLAAGGGPSPRGRVALVLALGAAALAGEAANVLVLPHLYAWFHAGLAILTGAAALLAARLALATRGPAPARARGPALAVAAALVVAVFAGVEAHGSQIVRFAALERTAATAELLRLSPVSMRARTLVAAHRREQERELPPLPEGPRRPEADVLLITVDALRADHVGAFGYTRRPTTPNIDALAARSVRFARAYAQAPHTSFSVASMLTGKYFPTLARLAPAETHDPITSPLRRYGWKTAAFYPPAVFYVDAKKLKAYADTNFGFEYVKFEYLEAQKRVDQILTYYQTVKPKRAFVWAHFFEPHEPYVAHPEYPFGDADIDRYDSEIAYADAAIGRLLAWLKANRPSTIVVLAADHGEEFDEHGGRYHGSSLFEEQVHVPLIVSVPGVSPRVVDRPVELIDIAPTVLNLLDIPVPARMRGTDLGPWLATPPAPTSRLPPAFAELEDKRMVVRGDDKLICDLNWGFCAYYDLSLDPREKQNRADERPDKVASLHALLDDWLDGHVRYEPILAKGDANPNGERVPKAIERGRLGDLMAGPALGALLVSPDAKLPVRREAAELLVALPPRPETAPQLARAASDPDQVVADWASVGAMRGGDMAAAPRVRALVVDPRRPRKLRVRGALALGARGDHAGVPTLAESLDDCKDDVLLCRLIILQLGKLRDRRAVPALIAHLGEVQNRREMVDALGDIGDPAAVPALLQRLQHDEYVPVRAQAARALAKIGRVDVVPVLDRVAHEDTEADVATAAREAITQLRKGRSG